MAKKIDQYYVWKFKSEIRFKDNNFNIQTSFEEAKNSEPKELVLVADNQFLRTIRSITQDHSKFNPYYVIVQFSSKKHYDNLYKHGLKINGKNYKRLSCSSSQARNSTVVFCDALIIDRVKDRIDNGRNKNIPLVPAKYNAYFGLAGSGTYVVTEPRFVIVEDFKSETIFKANIITETCKNLDDIVTVGDVKHKFNRFDGMGLISPEMAETWANDMSLDYTPSQFIIRQSFVKGMLCVFDFKDFCNKVNGGDYEITDIYGNKQYLDSCDVIITESQFKLWSSYNSTDHYIEQYKNNGLDWGVTQYSKRHDNDVVKMNYQFIQTLNLSQDDIEELCSQFVEWIKGVSYENIAYTLLFLMGTNNTEYSINKYFSNEDDFSSHWVKALAANPDSINDKYIRNKISTLFRKKVQSGCLGEIIVYGNYQFMVADPYALMQHVCNLPVTGLLGSGKFYSNYWNNKGVKCVDAMRAPLTDRSEHVLLNLIKNDNTEYWYRHLSSGIILNVFGNETLRFAGSDQDGDLLCTTDNQIIINGVYRDELPVYYKSESNPKKIIIDKDDKKLFKADKFSFGNIIGKITNKSTNAYALLADLTDEEEIKLVESRLKQCCKAQALQIDKTKSGESVKGIPSAWDNLKDSPYFFRYHDNYSHKKKSIKKYEKRFNALSEWIFQMSLSELKELDELDEEQEKLLDTFFENLPLSDSQCVMNLLCHHIESHQLKIKTAFFGFDLFDYQIYKNHNPEKQYDSKLFKLVKAEVSKYRKVINTKLQSSEPDINETEIDADTLKDKLSELCSDLDILVNVLVDLYYRDNADKKKGLLWNCYGDIIFKNVMINRNLGDYVEVPLPEDKGNILYLGRRYSMKKCEVKLEI